MRRQKGMFLMSRITIRSVARLGTGIFSLVVGLWLTAPCYAQQFKQIDKSTITIFDSFQSFPGYDVSNAIDTSPPSANEYISDYASLGGRANTFISFDFGQQYTFAAILFTDRTTSGGPNNLYVGGDF